MKLKFLIGLLIVLTLPAFATGRRGPFQTIRLDALKPDPAGCGVKWRTFVNQMVWTDEDHLVAWLIFFCDSPSTKDRKSPTELAVFDMAGHVRSVWSDSSPSEFFRDPQERCSLDTEARPICSTMNQDPGDDEMSNGECRLLDFHSAVAIVKL